MIRYEEKITATIDPKNVLKSQHRKEKHFYKEIIAVSGRSIPFRAKLYATGTYNYCCLWGSNEDIHFNGSGRAGGYGCHKESTALQLALMSAGVELSSDIAGRGEIAMTDAVIAVCSELGYNDAKIITSQG